MVARRVVYSRGSVMQVSDIGVVFLLLAFIAVVIMVIAVGFGSSV
jgi:hypothetical protein